MMSFLLLASAPLSLGVEAQIDAHDAIVVRADSGLSSESQFQAGSLAKYACTLTVLKLAEEGHLSLDDRIGDLLPDYSGPDAQNILQRDLLANRSGLPDDLLPAFRADPTIARAHLSALEASNRFAAGSIDGAKEWSYDLGNWILVQAAIEQVTGASLESVMAEKLLVPAGLEHTRLSFGIPDLVNSPEPAAPVRPLPPFLKCSGGLVSTPADLLRLVDWAYSGGLAQESLAALHQVTTEEEGYTLGGRVRQVGGRMLSWQTGSNGPYKTQLVYDPATGEGWAAMTASNSAEHMAKLRSEWLERLGEQDRASGVPLPRLRENGGRGKD
ncbi:serine hydrolase domain-containing protein [Qipengyuania flava]|uniref:serine hydrolase domain-containing protein n=1 Tax=Qipengyuania flava TaxID=192812 RepID=UPI001C6361EB|nr:serine hydrolase domain-containing protein [Qipengyuania flava]QYJ07905.1 beta-lactamase family protein [Qipengyuania flava]